jgi:hypothetical protein
MSAEITFPGVGDTGRVPRARRRHEHGHQSTSTIAQLAEVEMKCSHLLSGFVGLALALSGCAFSTTAKDWNGLKGLDDKPTYYMTTTKVGLNLLIAVPFIGDMGISGLTRDLTEYVKSEGGNDVRIVQGTTESYFYGWPPFTWVITPVVSTVSAEYEPSPEQFAKDQAVIAEETKEGSTARWYKPWSW